MIEPARVLRIVLRYQEGDETIYAKVHSRDPFESKPCSYKQLCNAIFRHNYVLNRIAQIYVFDKYGQKILLRDGYDVVNVVEREDLFQDTVYVDPCGVTREDPPTSAVKQEAVPVAKIPTVNRSEQSQRKSVGCEYCHDPIIGFRYKCTHCDDISWCMRCEAKSCHREHIAVRMPEPDTDAEQLLWNKLQVGKVLKQVQKQPESQQLYQIMEMSRIILKYIETLGISKVGDYDAVATNNTVLKAIQEAPIESHESPVKLTTTDKGETGFVQKEKTPQKKATQQKDGEWVMLG